MNEKTGGSTKTASAGETRPPSPTSWVVAPARVWWLSKSSPIILTGSWGDARSEGRQRMPPGQLTELGPQSWQHHRARAGANRRRVPNTR